MPRMMIAYEPMEVIVTPETTYIRVDHMSEFRRIYTDGRDWPENDPPSFAGYSIGKWVDEDGDGKYDVLEVETRGFKGPRTFDADGIPLHRRQPDRGQGAHLSRQGQSRTSCTTRSRPSTMRSPVPGRSRADYNRERDAEWTEYLCAEDNHQVTHRQGIYYRERRGF